MSNHGNSLPIYAIKDWDKHFENSESRKVKSLTWVRVTNKHDGKGYRRLVANSKSIQVFCAWNLIIQVASKMPVRGVLCDDDGPLTTSDLAFKTGFPEHIFSEAFKVLSEPVIGWLITLNRDGIPAHPDAPGDAGIEQKETEGDRTSTPALLKAVLEKGSGEKPFSPTTPEIPDEDAAVAMTMNAGVDEDFCRYVYRTWASQAGKNANGIEVPWVRYVMNRWKNEQVEWRAGTHRGNRKSGRSMDRDLLPENIPAKML